jgi:hypothetical protein
MTSFKKNLFNSLMLFKNYFLAFEDSFVSSLSLVLGYELVSLFIASSRSWLIASRLSSKRGGEILQLGVVSEHPVNA